MEINNNEGPDKRTATINANARLRELYLRSSTVCATLSRLLALFPDVSSSCIHARSTTAAMVVAAIMIGALHILHSLVVIGAWTASASWEVGNRLLDVNLLSLQQSIDDLSQSKVSRAEPAGVPPFVLALGLQPEEVSLGARRELKHVDPTIRRRLGPRWNIFVVRNEGAVGGHHH